MKTEAEASIITATTVEAVKESQSWSEETSDNPGQVIRGYGKDGNPKTDHPWFGLYKNDLYNIILTII